MSRSVESRLAYIATQDHAHALSQAWLLEACVEVGGVFEMKPLTPSSSSSSAQPIQFQVQKDAWTCGVPSGSIATTKLSLGDVVMMMATHPTETRSLAIQDNMILLPVQPGKKLSRRLAKRFAAMSKEKPIKLIWACFKQGDYVNCTHVALHEFPNVEQFAVFMPIQMKIPPERQQVTLLLITVICYSSWLFFASFGFLVCHRCDFMFDGQGLGGREEEEKREPRRANYGCR